MLETRRLLPLAGLVSLFLVGGVAEAGTLYAGPLRLSQGDNISCQIVNVGKRDLQEVVVEAHADGSDSHGPSTLAQGETEAITQGATVGSSTQGWCRFTFKGGKRNVRATACVLDSLACRSSVPAH